MIVSVDPNATVGGLYDKPQCCGVLILGTDNEGQSVISNLVYGTRTSLIVGLLAGLLATAIGLLVGLVAGYRGGWVDDVLTAITNVGLAIPAIVVIILVSVSLPRRNIYTLALVIGLVAWFWVARAVRAQASSIRTREHIDVARLVRRGLLVHPHSRRVAVPALLRGDGGCAAGLERDLVRVDAEPARSGPGQRDEPRNHALLGHRLGIGPNRRLVGVRTADRDADSHRVRPAAPPVEPQRGVQPAAASWPGGPQEGRGGRRRRSRKRSRSFTKSSRSAPAA